MNLSDNQQAFLALVRAGLWADLPVHGEGSMVLGPSNVDWKEVYRLAEEQAVVGLVAAGLDHVHRTGGTASRGGMRMQVELLKVA